MKAVVLVEIKFKFDEVHGWRAQSNGLCSEWVKSPIEALLGPHGLITCARWHGFTMDVPPFSDPGKDRDHSNDLSARKR